MALVLRPGILHNLTLDPANLPPESLVSPEVRQEILDLQREGYDIQLVRVPDPQALKPADQSNLDQYITTLEADPEAGYYTLRTSSSLRAWFQLTKAAASLHPIYGASTFRTLGEGIDVSAYSEPLFTDASRPGASCSARQLIQEGTKGDEIWTKYEQFITTPIDNITRRLLRGSADSRGVRARAVLATLMVLDHVGPTSGQNPKALRCASIACGAAGPMCRLVTALEDQGAKVADLFMIDHDPMALATGFSIARQAGISKRVVLQRLNLMRSRFSECIEAGTVDIADLLGVFEYFTNNPSTQMAAKLLRNTCDIMRPGGLIILANMLRHRPQEVFFRDITRWPRLQHRTIRQVLKIIGQAGLDPRQAIIRVAAVPGVYANFAIPVP